MPTGWYGLICCICFEGLTSETCAIDIHGDKWDMCPGQCAKDAGLEEMCTGITEFSNE